MHFFNIKQLFDLMNVFVLFLEELELSLLEILQLSDLASSLGLGLLVVHLSEVGTMSEWACWLCTYKRWAPCQTEPISCAPFRGGPHVREGLLVVYLSEVGTISD